jgi:hypothetical protein
MAFPDSLNMSFDEIPQTKMNLTWVPTCDVEDAQIALLIVFIFVLSHRVKYRSVSQFLGAKGLSLIVNKGRVGWANCFRGMK